MSLLTLLVILTARMAFSNVPSWDFTNYVGTHYTPLKQSLQESVCAYLPAPTPISEMVLDSTKAEVCQTKELPCDIAKLADDEAAGFESVARGPEDN